MSDPRLSLATRALLGAAKADAPGAAARAKIWSGVSGALGGAGAAGAAAAAGGGGAGAAGGGALAGGATKMLALGTLLGGTVTVGLAVALLHFGPAPSALPPATTAPIAAAATATALAPPLDVALPPPAATAEVQPPPPTAAVATAPPAATIGTGGAIAPPPRVRPMASGPERTPPSPPSAPTAAAASPTSDDTLTHEASLVAEARGALVRGDPRSALRAVRAARLLPSHQLVPEEMALEAQALRALGRDDDARDLDSTLKAQYPESAFAR